MGAASSTPAKPEEYERLSDGSGRSIASKPSALVVCGPSGVGKGTLINRLMTDKERFGFSCSHTTRSPREGEVDGKDYHFVTKQDFQAGVEAGEFLESAHVHNNMYGTTFKAVDDVASSGRCCVLDIDVQGTRLVRASRLQAIFVFIAPPSVEELEKRLRGRNTESEEQIRHRLQAAKEEIESVNEAGLYDFVIVNEDLESAAQHLSTVAKSALAGQVGNGSDVSPIILKATGVVPVPQTQGSGQGERQQNAQAGSGGEAQQTAGPSASAIASAYQPQHVVTPTQQQADGIARWRGKVALVTGASAGIGWSICEKLALEGLRVVAIARRRERLEALQQHLVDLGVPIADFLPVVCDITKEAEVVALPRIIVKRWPKTGIDVLVNNAGMGRNDASLFDGKTGSWIEMISTNVLGPCMCTREALQDMKRRSEWGHIINISSMAAHRVPDAANSGSSFYAATKFALRALTEGLRQEARGKEIPLRVAQISPGLVETEFDVVRTYGDTASAQERYSKFKCLQPEDIAQAVVWVLTAPDHVDVHDIQMRPVSQKL